jgi:hypothetical protein
MSGSNRNFVFAYAFLVILPLVGLAGILKSGRHLSAPPTIDGVWSLQSAAAQDGASSCVLSALPDKTLTISQSGQEVILSVPGQPNVIGSGTLYGTTLRGSMAFSKGANQAECSGPLSLLASVDRRADSRVLNGTLSVADCSTCAPLSFHAERQIAATPKEGR